jgi:hypothetical protein
LTYSHIYTQIHTQLIWTNPTTGAPYRIPRLKLEAVASYSRSKTQQYDEEATSHLMYVSGLWLENRPIVILRVGPYHPHIYHTYTTHARPAHIQQTHNNAPKNKPTNPQVHRRPPHGRLRGLLACARAPQVVVFVGRDLPHGLCLRLWLRDDDAAGGFDFGCGCIYTSRSIHVCTHVHTHMYSYIHARGSCTSTTSLSPCRTCPGGPWSTRPSTPSSTTVRANLRIYAYMCVFGSMYVVFF